MLKFLMILIFLTITSFSVDIFAQNSGGQKPPSGAGEPLPVLKPPEFTQKVDEKTKQTETEVDKEVDQILPKKNSGTQSGRGSPGSLSSTPIGGVESEPAAGSVPPPSLPGGGTGSGGYTPQFTAPQKQNMPSSPGFGNIYR